MHRPVMNAKGEAAIRIGLAMTIAVAPVQPAWSDSALPQGGVVAAGEAAISSSGSAMTITQTSSRAVINWSDFSIGSANSVTFNQPGSSSAILNRVTGSTPSTISGTLTANGQVFLVNPNGIAVTPSGVVDVGGFVASTLDITDPDFMSGALRFMGTGSSAAVENAGRITARRGGFAALLGGSVSNSGTIVVPLGRVGLGAGEQATLDLEGDGFLQVAVPTRRGGSTTAISHSGHISAEGGLVEIKAATAKDAIRNVVNIPGSISANSVEERGGKIVFGAGPAGQIKVSGRISATSDTGRGGDVTMTADAITLAGSIVDVSGALGGGTIRIGGDAHGAGALAHAMTTTIDAATILKADALSGGDGGSIVVWSDVSTTVAGEITARAWGEIGNGGFIETSSRGAIAFGSDALTIDASSASGIAGTWLIDPQDLDIDAAGAANIVSTLNGGTNVTATTSACNASYGTCSGTTGDITVSAAIAKIAGGAATLSLIADNNIIVNAGISSSSGTLAVNLTAAGTISGNASGTINTNGGALTLDAGSGSGTLAGAISGSGSLVKQGNGTTILGGANTFTGTTTVNAGTLDLSGSWNVGAGTATTSVGAGATLSGSGVITAGTLAHSGSGTVNLGGSNAVGAITTSGTIGDFTFNDAQILSLGSMTSTGAINITATTASASDAITLNGVTIVAGAGTSVISGTSGSGSGIYLNGSVALTGSGSSFTISGTSTSGSGIYDAATSLALSNTGAGAFSFTGTANSNNGITVAAGISVSTSGAVDITGTSTTSIGIYVLGATTISDSLGTATWSGTSGGSNAGIWFNSGAQSFSNTGAGQLVISGQSVSGAGLGFNTAVSLSTAGTVNLSGVSTSSSGIYFNSNNSLSTSSGALALTGTSTSGIGVRFNTGTMTLTNSGAGTFSFTGISTASVGYGIAVGSNLTTSGNISMLGRNTLASTGASNYGIFFNAATVTHSSGDLSISGEGSGGNGVWFQGGGTNAFINSGAGTVSVSGSSTQGRGIRLNTSAALSTQGTVHFSGSSTNDAGFSLKGSNAITVTSGALTISGATSSASFSGIDTSSSGNTVTNNGSGTLTFTSTGGTKLGGNITSNSGTVVMSDTGSIIQSGGIITTSALLVTGATSATLNNANAVGTLAASGVGSLSFKNAQSLGIGTVQAVAGISASGDVTITATGNLTIASGASVNAVNATLSATGAFINNQGSNAIGTSGGRWLVFSANPAGDTFGNLDSANAPIWNATYLGTGGTIAQSGNRYVFANQPGLTLTSVGLSKLYGADGASALAASYSITGAVAGVANVYLSPSAADLFTGAPALTSAGTSTTAAVGSYPISLAAGTTASATGYALSYVSAGSVTVDPKPLAITVNDASKYYGNALTFAGTEFTASGLVNSDAVSSISLATSGGGSGAAAGSYAITGSGATGTGLSNYTISYTAGTLVVMPRPITVTADAQTRMYRDPNPALTYSVGGFGLSAGDTLSGALATTAQESSFVGNYAITQGSLAASPNYQITFAGAILAIVPAADGSGVRPSPETTQLPPVLPLSTPSASRDTTIDVNVPSSPVNWTLNSPSAPRTGDVAPSNTPAPSPSTNPAPSQSAQLSGGTTPSGETVAPSLADSNQAATPPSSAAQGNAPAQPSAPQAAVSAAPVVAGSPPRLAALDRTMPKIATALGLGEGRHVLQLRPKLPLMAGPEPAAAEQVALVMRFSLGLGSSLIAAMLALLMRSALLAGALSVSVPYWRGLDMVVIAARSGRKRHRFGSSLAERLFDS